MKHWSVDFGQGRPYYSYARVLCAQWGPRPYLCWVGGGSGASFHLLRIEDGRVSAIYAGCQFEPVVAAVARRESGLDWLPDAGPDNLSRRPHFEIERRRSPVVRVFERLAEADKTLVDPRMAEHLVRGGPEVDCRRAANRLDCIAGSAVRVAGRCDGLPIPEWGFVRGTAVRADYCTLGRETVASAWRAKFMHNTCATSPHLSTLSLEDLLRASGWSRCIADLDELVARERLVIGRECGGALDQLSLL